MREEMIRSVTITSGQSLSGILQVPSGYSTVSISMPSSWTAAELTFAACDTPSGTFQDLYDSSGTEIVISVGAARYIVLTTDDILALLSCPYLKVRSGLAASPINQEGNRILKFIFKL